METTLDVSATDVGDIVQMLQQSLHEISAWCNANYMIPNPQKTKCMLVTNRQKHQNNPPPLVLQINDESIEQVREHNVLGVLIDERLSWQPHTDMVCKTLSKNLHLLSRLSQFH